MRKLNIVYLVSQSVLVLGLSVPVFVYDERYLTPDHLQVSLNIPPCINTLTEFEVETRSTRDL